MESSPPLHIVLFPWQAFGHMIPYLELAKSLASRGHLVSFLSTPRNISRLPTLPTALTSLLRFVPLAFTSTSDLPTGAECTSDLPHTHSHLLLSAVDSLQKPVADFLSTASPKPDWVIHDFAPFWVPPIASKLGIPCAVFNIFSSSFVAYSATMMRDPTAAPFPFPAQVAFRAYEIKELIASVQRDTSAMKVGERWKTVETHCKFLAIRSSDDFDGDWLGAVRQIYASKPVIPVGLLPPIIPSQKNPKEMNKFDDWLRNQSPGSVVYVSFGSEATLTTELYHELAFGIELSGLPFFWALRRPPAMPKNKVLLPDGFADRTTERGFVTMDWVPQREILGHVAVGGFLTHCGWSSIVEGLGFGRPLVMLPMLFDQGVNAQVMAQRKVGVEIGRNEEDGSFTRDAVAKALRLVMVEEEGKEIRENAEKTKDVCGDKGRNDKYVDGLVRYMRGYNGQEEGVGVAK